MTPTTLVAPGGMVSLVREHARPLAFGLLHALFSAPGQTFFIGLFITSYAASFDLSAAEIGGLYLLGTLASAMTLLCVGHLIDRVPLRTYSTACIAALAGACFLMASAAGPLTLGLAFYALRLTGQGLMMHVEATATARAFAATRGRALGITGLGGPLSEALFPSFGVLVIATLGWRWAYGILGIALLVVVLPLARILARSVASPVHGSGGSVGSGFRAGLLLLARSRFVWAALPALAIMPFFSTGLMFNISSIAAVRGWPGEMLALSFPVMATAALGSLLLSGRLIDRYSARLVFLFHPFPLIVALALLGAVEASWALPVALALVGCSGGASKTTVTAIWAELFGIANLGTMRSIVMMYSVLASALAPFVFGLLTDAGWSISQVLMTSTVVALTCALPVMVRAGRPTG